MNIILRVIDRLKYNHLIKTIEFLKQNGAIIGDHNAFFSGDITIDTQRPWLLHIGDYCKITKGVVILTHDYSLSVLRRKYGIWVGEGRKTFIGDNVFLGMNCIVLMGAHIGNNCIVGAGSVVHGSFPDNCVISGNPARIISSLDEYYEKRSKKTIEEAKECAKEFILRMGRDPSPKDLKNFRFLFSPRDKLELKKYGLESFACSGDDPDDVEFHFHKSLPFWENFDIFLMDVKKEMEM